jgi:hypothetical protein
MRTDRQLLLTLAFKARVIDQNSAEFRIGAAGLSRLVRQGWVRRFTLLARPVLPLSEPLSISVDDDADRVAYLAQSRWREGPRPTRAVTITRKGARVFGLRPPLIEPLKATHDLHVGAIVFQHYWNSGELVGEDLLKRYLPPKSKVPDLALIDADYAVYKHIDFGGCYNAERIRSLMAEAKRQGVGLEIW